MSRRNRLRIVSAVAALAVLLVAALALARPGGGQSYSGPRSSGGGSGGGGGGGDLIALLLWLVFQHPAIGIPVVIIVLVIVIVRHASSSSAQGWETGSGSELQQGQQEPVISDSVVVPRSQLDRIRAIDPDFSLVLFDDFVYMLYAQLQRGRAGQIEVLAAYVSAAELARLHSDPNLAAVSGIVIGAVRAVGFSGVNTPRTIIELEFEANYVEAYRQGNERRFYVKDRLQLQRARDAKSRPFERARTLDCPNCGAPLSAVRGTQCSYCRRDVGGGQFDWQVDAMRTLSKEPRGPLLTSDVEEGGTNLPTIVDPRASERMRALQQRDPSFRWEMLQARLAHVFGALQSGWSGRNPAVIRPYVSDNLFQSMVYWLDLYTSTHCRNVTENARILQVDIANVLSDKHYDAITVRVFAQGSDYTVSDDGRLLSGSRSRERTYSEYWTLIRGTQRRGEPKGDANCPNCGASKKE